MSAAPSEQWGELLSRVRESLFESLVSGDASATLTSPNLSESSYSRAVLAAATFLRATAGALEDVADDIAEDDDDLLLDQVEHGTAAAYELSRTLLRHLEEGTWSRLIENNRARPAPRRPEVPLLSFDFALRSAYEDTATHILASVKTFQARVERTCAKVLRDLRPLDVSGSTSKSWVVIDLGAPSALSFPHAADCVKRTFVDVHGVCLDADDLDSQLQLSSPLPTPCESTDLRMASASNSPKADSSLWSVDDRFVGSAPLEHFEENTWAGAARTAESARLLDLDCELWLLKAMEVKAATRALHRDRVRSVTSKTVSVRRSKVATIVGRLLAEPRLTPTVGVGDCIPQVDAGLMMLFLVSPLLCATNPRRFDDWKEGDSLHLGPRLPNLLPIEAHNASPLAQSCSAGLLRRLTSRSTAIPPSGLSRELTDNEACC